jgi:uncharacterized protein (TIGR02145 family)
MRIYNSLSNQANQVTIKRSIKPLFILLFSISLFVSCIKKKKESIVNNMKLENIEIDSSIISTNKLKINDLTWRCNNDCVNSVALVIENSTDSILTSFQVRLIVSKPNISNTKYIKIYSKVHTIKCNIGPEEILSTEYFKLSSNICGVKDCDLNSYQVTSEICGYKTKQVASLIIKNKQENTKEVIKDGSGNSYNAIKIGNQYWLDQNLKTTKYLDGSNIKLEADYLNWPSLSIGAYSTSNSNFQKETGIIYNWYVINQSKNVCPAGWHVPHLDEWEALFKHLGGIELAGIKLKEIGSTHWSKDNESTNETKFSAKSSSAYGVSGEFVFSCFAGAYLNLWCSNQSDIDEAFTISFSTSEDEVKVHTSDKNSGYAIRCIKD